jgi:mRNA-degrading endonuclease RelE of RelBE toxin-antitoxin system
MEINFSNNSKKQLEKLDARTQQRIIFTLEKFKNNQSVDIIKLRGGSDEFRIRVGNYRIQLQKVNEDILITKIGKRENFYLVFL